MVLGCLVLLRLADLLLDISDFLENAHYLLRVPVVPVAERLAPNLQMNFRKLLIIDDQYSN